MKTSELFANCAWNVQYKNVDNWVSYAFIEDKTKLYIYFQGSYEKKDWWANFNFFPALFKKRPYKNMEISFKVHRGFLKAWKTIEDLVIAKITEKNAKNNFKWKDITVVGYSHGGSLTFFATECIWYYRPDLRKKGFRSFAFESPRVLANYKVPEAIKERWNNMIVVKDGNDLVTRCPPHIFGYCHAGELLKVEGDTSLVEKKIPKCIKYHFPQVVYDALIKYEHDKN